MFFKSDGKMIVALVFFWFFELQTSNLANCLVFEFAIRNFIRVPLELVSEELNHFRLIAGLFRQIRGHTGWFVLFALFEDFSLKLWLKVYNYFHFLFEKIFLNFFLFYKNQTPAKTCKMVPRWFNSLDTNSSFNINKRSFILSTK